MRLIGAAVVMLAGCVREDYRPTQYAELKRRAAFDLKCSEASISIVPIKEVDTDHGCAKQHHFASAQTAGVTCNENRATYEYVRDRWLMNNDGHAVSGK